MKTALFFLTILLSTLPSARAGEGSEGHSGGGMWVCRASDHSIQWSSLVDLWEATSQYGLEMQPAHGADDKNGFLARIRARVSGLDAVARTNYGARLEPFLSRVNGLEPGTPQLAFTQEVLKVIDDADLDLSPQPSVHCAGGSLAYEQVVNFRADGWIFVQQDLYDHLDEQAKAALVYHEAIYAMARYEKQAKTSVFTRRVVGVLLSTLSDHEGALRIAREIKNINASTWPLRFGNPTDAPAPANLFASIAYNRANGNVTASWNYAAQIEADQHALATCRSSDCATSASSPRKCVAVAVDSLRREQVIAYNGTRRPVAEKAALEGCAQRLGLPCELVASACNGPL